MLQHVPLFTYSSNVVVDIDLRKHFDDFHVWTHKKKTAADQSLAHSSFNWNTEMQIFQALKTDERIMHIDLNCACHKLCTGSHSSSRIGFVVLASLNITRCSCSSKRKRGVS